MLKFDVILASLDELSHRAASSTFLKATTMKIDKFFRAVLLIGVLFSSLTQSAHAGIFTYTGDTSGGPTYNRTLEDLSDLSALGTDVSYQTRSFTFSAAGDYTFLMTSDYDGMLFLYQDSFNPNAPTTNGVAGSDDLFGTTTSGFYGPLLANVTYVLVATSFENDVTGKYSITIGGPGVISAVPEPSTWLMLGLGLAAVGYARRRKALR
jgi:hypothetical protein